MISFRLFPQGLHVKPANNASLPLRIGSPEQFAAVATALREADFTEASILGVLKLNDMSDLGAANSSNSDLTGLDPRLCVFMRLFLFFELVPCEEVKSALGRSTLDAFLALDLLRGADESGSSYYAAAFLYPVADLYMTSDRPVALNSSDARPDDWVFPAIFEGTLDFLRLLLKSPADDALDLCSGSGVAALVLSRNAAHAVAADLTARATHYARFNRILNGRNNVEVVQGDLYGAVPGRTFDRIVAHPPYVPALRDQAIYRAGGVTGEQLVRRIIEGLPRHLRRGGTYFALSLNIDTASAPFEERARKWLGPAQSEFDIVLATGFEKAAESTVQNVADRDASVDVTDIARMREALAAIGATRFVYGALAARRRTPGERGKPRTLRMRMSHATTGADLEALLRTSEGSSAGGS
jgi:SAM-dependent methyltransferase